VTAAAPISQAGRRHHAACGEPFAHARRASLHREAVAVGPRVAAHRRRIGVDSHADHPQMQIGVQAMQFVDMGIVPPAVGTPSGREHDHRCGVVPDVKVERVEGTMPREAGFNQDLCTNINGFNLHAAVSCNADERQAPEQLCRYITRPALVNERVQCNAAGQVVLKLKTPRRDGTIHSVMSPLEFTQRPAPRQPLICPLSRPFIMCVARAAALRRPILGGG
jgi:Putative transposase